MHFLLEPILSQIESLAYGFFFDTYNEKEVALLMKFEASIITSIMQECPIEIILSNPKIANRTTTLCIKDNLESPLLITWQNFSSEDSKYKGFDEVIIRLIKSDKLKIVLLNELTHPVFIRMVSKKNQFLEFDKWYYKIMSSPKEPSDSLSKIDHFSENNDNGFKIEIQNIGNSNEKAMFVLAPFEASKWGNNLINGESHFKIDEYIIDGKHGYNQEFSVRSILNWGFKENEELFYSPKKTNGKELTDFLVVNNNLAILIESKYVISEKTNKLNKALSKAVNQLIKAENIIWDNVDEIENEELRERLSKCKIIFKICVYNDAIILNDRSCQNIIKKHDKEDIPIFISVRVLSEFIAIINRDARDNFSFSFIVNLARIYYNFIDSDDEIMIVRNLVVKGETSNQNYMPPDLFE